MNDFLDFLWPDHGINELRVIGSGPVRQEFFRTSERGGLVQHALEYDSYGWDCYIGVVPRRYASGTADDCWPTTTVLWADVDAKKFCPQPESHEWGTFEDKDGRQYGLTNEQRAGRDKGIALDTILRFPHPPSCINDSGHGYHVFWKLDSPAEMADAIHVMKGIAKWVNGDAVYDAPRVLRLPGTNNHKDPENPVPVRLLKLDHLRKYELSDFAEITACLEVTRSNASSASHFDRRQDAPDMLKELIDSDPPKGTRSEVLYHAVAWMKELGYSFDEALMVVMNSPVGAKAQERGERWAEGEVGRIWRKVQ